MRVVIDCNIVDTWGRTRRNRLKLQQGISVWVGIRKTFLTVRVVKHCNSFPKGTVESPSLESVQVQNTQTFGWDGLNRGKPALSRGWDHLWSFLGLLLHDFLTDISHVNAFMEDACILV